VLLFCSTTTSWLAMMQIVAALAVATTVQTDANNCANLIEPIFGTAAIATSVGIQCDGDLSTCSNECTGTCTNIYNFQVCCNCGGGDHITTSTCGSTCDFKQDLQPIEILDGSDEDKCAVVRALVEGETGCLSTCTHDELNTIVKNAKTTHLDGPAGIPATWYTNETYKCSIAGFTGALNTADLAIPPTWIEMRGCCRERVSGVPKRKRYLSHHDNLISETEIIGGTMATAVASCKADCAADDLCTAFELHKTKKIRNKKKSKKKSKGYKCELHKATINSSTRKSKSCKKAKCFTKETSVPTLPKIE